jgi:superfamily II DNA or RNA helicase
VFLAFPIKFKGSVVQFVGRILRPAPGKTSAVVHDYVDIEVPVLARTYAERAGGYTARGFAAPRGRLGR